VLRAPGVGVHAQLRAEVLQRRLHLGHGFRRVDHAHGPGHHRHVRHVPVGVDGPVAAVVEVGAQHRVGQSQVHPQQQPRILGRVAPAVAGDTLHPGVHGLDRADRLLGQVD